MQRPYNSKRRNQSRNNRVKLVKGGKEFFQLLLRLIGEATETIHLQTYIFDNDDTGRLVTEALKAAASRKVQVYVLADGFASQSLSKSFLEKLKEEGINFRLFEPLLKSKNFYFGRRLHHKITVIDTKYALVGGINISDKYNDLEGAPAWLDFALFVEGDIAKQLCVLCRKTWKGFPTLKPGSAIRLCKDQVAYHFPESEQCIVRICRNDWFRQKNEISRSYINMFRNSKSKIIILSSYFLPGQFFRQSIKKAVKRGVSIKIIIAGRSDVLLSKNAERYWYDWLLRNHIEIYEYNKNVLHGKLAACDGKLMTIGSFNVNDLSTYSSIELNLEVQQPALAIASEKMLEEIMKNDCSRITESLFHTRNIFTRVSQWASYQIVHTLFKLCTFHFNHQE